MFHISKISLYFFFCITLFSCESLFAEKTALQGYIDFVKQHKMSTAALVGGSAYCGYKLFDAVNNHPSRVRWDWETINTSAEQLCFPKDFLWATATSAYQVEGEDGATEKPYNQYHRCEGDLIAHRSENACEHWIRYKEDIALMKQAGFNAYRFSISWGKVEPKQGEFNEAVLQHYENVCKELIKNGIKPIVTLHHYTHPCWFEDLGGFEKEENIQYFERFCKTVFMRLHTYVHLWFSFNTFTGHAFGSFHKGYSPPYKKDLALAIQVLKHMLEAHVRVYHSLKAIDASSSVGIYKNIFQIDPWNLLNPADRLFSWMGNYLSNDSIFNFFTKGVFKIWIPTKVKLNYENKQAIGALDCVGLNYYSGAYVKNFKIVPRPECISVDKTDCTIYPEGFYRALHTVSEKLAYPLGVPIYVTENGISSKNEEHRDIFLRQYLYALSQAVQDGIDVRGYTYWSFMDNYEWSHGYNHTYGIYAVDFETQERSLRESALYLLDAIKNHTQYDTIIPNDINDYMNDINDYMRGVGDV